MFDTKPLNYFAEFGLLSSVGCNSVSFEQEYMIRPEKNLVVWLLREGKTPWPVVMLSQSAAEDEWAVRLFGEENKKTIAHIKDLRDYAAHLFYAFQASGKMRSQMALACTEAHSFGRCSAPVSQRTELISSSFDSFAHALTGKVLRLGNSAKRRKSQIEWKVDEKLAREHCSHCDEAVKEQASAINTLEESQKNAEKKLREVREEAARLYADENHWREKEESLRHEVRQASAKLAEAHNAVERCGIEERAAVTELQEQDNALDVQRQELEVRQMHKRAAFAFLEQCGVDESKFIEETQDAGIGNNSCSTRKKKVSVPNSVTPSTEYGTSSISTWDITDHDRMFRQPVTSSVPLTIRVVQSRGHSNSLEQSQRQYGLVTQAQAALIAAARTTRNDSNTPKQHVISEKLPSNARYMEAAEELGVRMVVYDGDVVYDLGNEGIYAAKYFKRDLKAFHRKHGFEGYAVPNSQGKEVDVYRLLKTVLSWGGIDAVRSSSRIGQMCDAVDVRRGTASILKRFYISFLFPYEQALVVGRVPSQNEIIDMLNSNKNGSIVP